METAQAHHQCKICRFETSKFVASFVLTSKPGSLLATGKTLLNAEMEAGTATARVARDEATAREVITRS